MAITKDRKIAASILSAALLFLIVGGWMLIADVLDYKEGTESNKWLPIGGIIKSNSIRLQNRNGGINHFKLNADYIYHVNDEAFRGDRVGYPNELLFTTSQPEKSSPEKPDNGKEETSKSIFAKYAATTPVTVFYNPSNKQQSTLTRGASVRRYLFPFLRDVALTALAIAMAFWGFKLMQQPKPTA